MAHEKWILALVPVVCALLASRGILHFFQLESYQFPGYFRTLKRNKRRAFLPGLCVTAVAALLYGASSLFLRSSPLWVSVGLSMVLLVLAGAGGYWIAQAFAMKNPKRKFVYTNRIKRLYCVFTLVMIFVSVLLAWTRIPILFLLWPVLLPLVIGLSGLLAWPFEKMISELYFRDARRKLLSMTGLIRIGITGSYGKTSVKHILGTILSEKYPTLITPASFNTPMGVARVIRDRLTPSYQVFIGEMGARHVGDIREMCRLVKPRFGILTSVGPQHLDTFKTVDRVAKTKYELIEALPTEGSSSYFFDDGGICRQLYERTAKTKTLVSLHPGDGKVWCDSGAHSSLGSSFTLHIQGKGSIECQTVLLGEHNLQNILLAAAVASDLNLSLKQIAHGILKLEPVKGRLELISHPGRFTIINDGFNSNPVSAKAALNVLSAFPKRRIILTPGLVELGAKEEAYNYEFGCQIAQCADIAIVIGRKRAAPIIEGLRASGFLKEQIYQVTSLEESTEVLYSFVHPEDTVLYENDLPENYQEA